MTSRRTGRRAAAARRTGRSARGGMPRAGRRKEEPLAPRERRQLVQLVICGGVFVLLVAAKLLLPGRMDRLNAALSQAMEQNMDVEAVFSAVGRAFAGESGVEGAVDEVYRAVFHPDEAGEALETSAQAAVPADPLALESLRAYIPEEPEADPTETGEDVPAGDQTVGEAVSSLAYVLYSDQNLPEDVSMAQAILNFDYGSPVDGTLSSPFGYREHPVEGEGRFHYGVDLAADTGTEIRCFADGTVKAVGESSSYGKYCIVDHPGGYSTLYAHCSAITTSSGAEVKGGEKIAEVGETGIATGPHLHFELQQDGVYLNPIYYVS